MLFSKKFIIIIASVGLVVVVAGLFWYFSGRSPEALSLVNPADISLPKDFSVGGETINLNWTDENQGENLLIQSNEQTYYGLGQAKVYFSITNQSGKDQDTAVVFWFDGEDKQLEKAEKIENNQISVLQFSRLPEPTAQAVGGQAIFNQDSISNFQSFQNRRKDNKDYTTAYQIQDLIKTGQTNFYKATINFPETGEGEFYIEAFGDQGGYGQLI